MPLWISVACRCKWTFSGCSSNFFSNRIPNTFFHLCCRSFRECHDEHLIYINRRLIYCQSRDDPLYKRPTAVFPEPAAADTRIFLFLRWMTCACSFVQDTPSDDSPLSFFIIYSFTSCSICCNASHLSIWKVSDTHTPVFSYQIHRFPDTGSNHTQSFLPVHMEGSQTSPSKIRCPIRFKI